MATRLALFLWVYLAAEAGAIVALFLAWAVPPRSRLVERTYRLQALWAAFLFGAARRLFSLRFDVEGADAVAPGPIVVLMRHASIVDNLLPLFVAAPHGLRLRYVLKRELLSDPAIDIAGGRLPNCFVLRGADDAEAEIARVRALAAGLGPDEGVLIYPEGRASRPRSASARSSGSRGRPSFGTSCRRGRAVPSPSWRRAPTSSSAPTTASTASPASATSGAAGSCGGRCGSASAASRLAGAGRARTNWLWQRWHEVDDWIGAQRGGVSAGEILLDAAVIAGLMIALWLVSLRLRDASIVDPFWGLGFVIVGWTAALAGGALRLGARALDDGLGLPARSTSRAATSATARTPPVDAQALPRFELTSLVIVFGLQGLLLWIVALPLQLAPAFEGSRDVLGVLGVAVWAVGLAFEAVGDAQLARFRADPANKGRVLENGLWRYTRHPNYFGDACVWWGLWLVALAAGAPWWTVVGPVVMTVLLPRLGRDAARALARAAPPGYEEYVRRTSAFVPRPPRA